MFLIGYNNSRSIHTRQEFGVVFTQKIQIVPFVGNVNFILYLRLKQVYIESTLFSKTLRKISVQHLHFASIRRGLFVFINNVFYHKNLYLQFELSVNFKVI